MILGGATMGWAEVEFQGINLGDRRLNRRAAPLAERLAERPTASIPGACNGWGETPAADRFLGNDRYDWMDLLEPHRQCTQARLAAHLVVRCRPDTTELNFNG